MPSRTMKKRHALSLAILVGAVVGCADSHLTEQELRTPAMQPAALRTISDASESQADDLDAGADPDSSIPQTPISPETWILTDELNNARDLGGIQLSDSVTSSFRLLYRGQTLVLSESGCDEFARLSIRTVVDLRGGFERLFSRNAECVQESAEVVTAPLGSTFDYMEYVTTPSGLDSIAETFAVLGNPEAYPVYIHCTYGRDRTGVMSALILSALGASRSAIMDEYNRSSETVGAYPDRLEGVLDEVEAQGGIDAFLENAGVMRSQLDTLRAVAVAR